MPVSLRYEGSGRASGEARAAVVRLRRQALRMLAALGLPQAQLSVLLCDDRVMHGLNREHRGIDRPTDVLAFAMREGKSLVSVHPELLGDIVISLPTAKRQAREHLWPASTETCLLLAHGLLHLLGFDHRTRAQERTMTARTHLLMAAALGTGGDVDKPGRRPRRPRARARRATSAYRK